MKTTFFIALLLVAAIGCTQKDAGTAVPRRTAYARVAEYPDSTRAIAVGALQMHVNAGTQISTTGDGWCDVAYPLYGATIHLTARRFADGMALEAAVVNREERMALNIGDNAAEQTEFVNKAGFNCLVLRTLAADPVPVQFLAVGTDGNMLAGSAAFKGRCEPYDSIAPMVDVLEAHTIALLKSLSLR